MTNIIRTARTIGKITTKNLSDAIGHVARTAVARIVNQTANSAPKNESRSAMNEHMYSDLPPIMWNAVEGMFDYSDAPHIHIMRVMKFITIGLIPKDAQ